MTRVERLKTRKEFISVQRNSKSRATPAFVLLYQPLKSSEDVINVGFTASKKVGNAVRRNRARRRLKALTDNIMRLNKNFKSPKPLRMVFIARFAVFDRNFEKMEKELKTVLKELKCEF